MNEHGIAPDLYILASICVRVGLKLHTLAVVALLYRRGWLNAVLVHKYSGMSVSKVYSSLQYLEKKGLAERRTLKDDGVRGYAEWRLTERGRELVTEYERGYRELRRAVIERW